jgi:hypothetical protein
MMLSTWLAISDSSVPNVPLPDAGGDCRQFELLA